MADMSIVIEVNTEEFLTLEAQTEVYGVLLFLLYLYFYWNKGDTTKYTSVWASYVHCNLNNFNVQT